MPMSQHDWRNWETCQCGEPGCRSSYPNRKWKQMNEDPIAAHLTELIADAPAPNHEEDDYDAGYVAALADLRDSAAFKLVVEQHANGRIAELATKVKALEADITHRKVRNTLSRMGRDDDPETIAAWRETVMGWMYRAENAELEAEDLKSTIARVEKLAHDMRGWCSPHGISVTYSDRIRAALEGES